MLWPKGQTSDARIKGSIENIIQCAKSKAQSQRCDIKNMDHWSNHILHMYHITDCLFLCLFLIWITNEEWETKFVICNSIILFWNNELQKRYWVVSATFAPDTDPKLCKLLQLHAWYTFSFWNNSSLLQMLVEMINLKSSIQIDLSQIFADIFNRTALKIE